MLEFIAQHGPDIISAILGLCGLIVGVHNVVKCFKMGKKIDTTTVSLETNIQLVKDGIVEAFKSAKLPNEIRLSISTKIEEVLGQARDMLLEEFKKNEAMRTCMMVMILKILSFTAASNKLTEDEKKEIEDLLKLMSEDTTTINI